MNQQPDKIFRDKLQHYQPPVSAAAWSRVSGNLRQRSDRMLWLKVAAGLLLLAVAGILLVAIDRDSPRLAVSEKPDTSREQPATGENLHSQPQRLPEDPSSAKEKAATPSPVTEAAPQKKSVVKKDGKRAVPSRTTGRDRSEENPLTTAGAPLDNILNQEQDAPAVTTESAVVAAAENQNITIVFTPAEVETYLMKKTAEAEATSEDQEASTWRKLLDKAYDLKHNQDPLGNLRQKKNEILALNFKNDKQSHENK